MAEKTQVGFAEKSVADAEAIWDRKDKGVRAVQYDRHGMAKRKREICGLDDKANSVAYLVGAV